jgi:O-antigen ligase
MTSLAYAFLWLFTFSIPWESSLMIAGLGSGPTGEGTVGRLIGLITAPVGVVAVMSRGRVRPLTLFHILGACFVAWAGLTAFWSVDIDRTIPALVRAAQVFAIPWLIWELADEPSRRRGLLQAYVFGAYVSSISTFLNYKMGIASSRSAGDRFAAEGFNPNELGFLLVLALPIAWHLGITHRNAILRWVNRLFIPVGIVAILLTGSRSSLIGAALALVLVPMTMGRLSLGMKAGVLSVMVATVVAAMIYVPETTWTRLGTTTEELESGTLNERTTIWKAGLELFPRHPIGGVGVGAFNTAVEDFLGDNKGAHNTFLSVLIEEGVVGLVLFTMMLLSIYFHVRSAAPADRRFALVLLLSLFFGLLPRAYEFKKVTWLMFGLLLAPSVTAAAVVYRARPRAIDRGRIRPRPHPVGPEPVRGQSNRLT